MTSRRLVLEADVFRSLVVRERKRSDRSERPFALLMLGGLSRGDAARARSAVAALWTATRDTDAFGWFEEPGTIGVLAPELPVADAAASARRLLARCREALAASLGSNVVDELSIECHVHPVPGGRHDEGLAINLVLYPELRDGLAVSRALKRAFDVTGAVVLLALLSPLFLLVAAVVKTTSPGPVFFRQVRIGHRLQPFTMLKFRTMHRDADATLHREFVRGFIAQGGRACEAGASPFKLVNDPRVTPVGRILRRTSLDELPQLGNVLRGEMSLVGPRPPIAYELDDYRPWHRRRVIEARPGITGLWQVVGRSRASFDEMVRLDLRYIRRRSLWMDARIVLATFRAVLGGRGAW
jgi:lipopolysaccharide/colanic/teichoic acid biosynthesis glycosyltransferase